LFLLATFSLVLFLIGILLGFFLSQGRASTQVYKYLPLRIHSQISDWSSHLNINTDKHGLLRQLVDIFPMVCYGRVSFYSLLEKDEIYSAIKRNELLLCTAVSMNFKIIRLHEWSQMKGE
jgi:hypothetical protein